MSSKKLIDLFYFLKNIFIYLKHGLMIMDEKLKMIMNMVMMLVVVRMMMG
jgi:hypothetical protein